MTSDTSSFYDLNLLRTNSGGDDDFVREIVSMFKESSDSNLDTLSKNCVAGPCHDWVEAAHSLKGGAGMIGAENLRALAATAQKAEDTTEAERSDMYKNMKDLYTKTCDALIRDGFLSA